VTARRLGWLLLVVGAIAVLTTAVVAGLASNVGYVLERLPLPLGFYLTAAVAFILRPGHRAARRMLAYGMVMAVAVAAGNVYSAAFPDGRSHQGAWLGALVLEALTWLQFVASVALFAVFPDGRYQRRYERRLVLAAAAALPAVLLAQLVGSAHLLTSDLTMTNTEPTNPAAVAALAPLGAVATVLLRVVPVVGGYPLTLAILIARYRRFGAEQRRQIAWPLYALALTGGCLVVMGALSGEVTRLPYWAVFALYDLIGQLLPLGLVIGMLRYRLLDIDLVVRRSLVYAVLWLLISAGYIGVAAVFGVLVSRRVPLELAIVLTILATVVAAPARRRLERLADRLVFGRRLSGYELIGQLGSRLQSSPAPEDVAATVATTVHSGLGARWVRVVLDRPQRRSVAAAGIELVAPAEPTLRVPLTHGGEHIGTIECGPKSDGRYTPADSALLETLGRQAALAIRNSQLSAELSDRLAELAASRSRLVQAEEAGRRRLERDIHDGVQQELVAVLARLGLARNQLRRDKGLAEATLVEVQADGRRALESLQELVRGIYPPLLTDRGLVEAVEERVARLPIPAQVSSDGLPRGTRFAPDVEGGAYFFVSEALGNVLKHARATNATVRLTTGADTLTIEVCDDGRGFLCPPDNAVRGSGLQGLRDRIEALGGRMEISSNPGSGSALRAWLPTGGVQHHG
jgi:signal transduction histidine kinase